VDESFDARTLEVAAPGAAPERAASSSHGFALNLPAGEYDVFVSVGRRDGTPVIALPLADTDGHRRYKLGKITVAPKAQP